MQFFTVLIDLLSDRDKFIQEIYDGVKIRACLKRGLYLVKG